jgi:hypothetical protein
MRKSFFSNRLFKLLLAGLVFLFVLLIIQKAYVQPPPAPTPLYTVSGHGNILYGVNRTGLITPINFNYSIGNCAHCHEQHASIGGAEPAPNSPVGPDYYLLFKDLWISPPQSNEFCFGCHIGTGSYQSSWGRTPDFACYSYRAGGDTSLTCPASVYESFQFVTNAGASQLNCGSSAGSSHLLRDMRGLLSGQWGFLSNNDYVDPCSGCHNPHRAKRDPHDTSGERTDAGYLIVSSVSKPSDHSSDNSLWDLWGDESGERMSDYTSSYCAPYRVNSTTTREPDGCSAIAASCLNTDTCTNGSNLFDSVTFCRDCHQYQISGTARTVMAIDWDFDQHGKADNEGKCNWGDVKEPYSQSGTKEDFNYVLSCLDCHEPHGSPNEFLLRQEVNGVQVPNFSTHLYYNFCLACHTVRTGGGGHMPNPRDTLDCWGCHRHGNRQSSGMCSNAKTF